MRRLRCLFLLAMLSTAPSLAAEPSGCPLPGEKIQWIADYCMSRLETDDEIAAGSCINKESAKRFKNDCIAKLHYKQAMCELAIARGHIAGGVNRCLADQDFVGSTVRNGGVGGNLLR